MSSDGKPDRSRQAESRGSGFAIWLAFVGLVAFLLVLAVNPALLSRWAEDNSLAPGILSGLRRARIALSCLGVALLGLGLAGARFRFFRLLDRRRRLARWLTILTGTGFVITVLELFFAAYPVPSLHQSVPYDISAFSINRLASFDYDVQGTDRGSIRYPLHGGYRGPAFPPEKPPGEYRIAILGGSFVFDIYASGENDWPHQVEELLHRDGYPRVRVINGGVPGHSTFDAIGRLTGEVDLLHPDLVVLCEAWNDIKYFNEISPRETPMRVIRPMTRPTHRGYTLAWLRSLLDQTHTFRLLFALGRRLRNAGLEGYHRAGALGDTVSAIGPEQYRFNLRNFVDICRNGGMQPVLFTQPHLPMPGNESRVKRKVRYDYVLLTHPAVCRAFEQCEEAARDVSREKACPLLDLSGQYSGREELLADQVHLTETGDRTVARTVASFFETFIPKEDGGATR